MLSGTTVIAVFSCAPAYPSVIVHVHHVLVETIFYSVKLGTLIKVGANDGFLPVGLVFPSTY